MQSGKSVEMCQKIDSFAANISIANHGLLDLSTCSYCCLAKDKVCSCDCRAALVQIKFWAERRGKDCLLHQGSPKGVCIDLRTNHCQCVQVLQKKKKKGKAEEDYSWAYGWRAEGKLSAVAETPATLGVYRGGHHPFREQCLIDQLTWTSKY